MSAKLFLTVFLIVLALPSSAGVADQNARLKLLIERAKARKVGEVAQPTTTAPAVVVPVAVPVTPVVIPAAIPVAPVVVPAAVIPTPVTTPTVSSPVRPTAPVKVRPVTAPTPAPAPLPERKPKVLETHPKEAVKEVAPVPQASPAAEKVIIRERPVSEQAVRTQGLPVQVPATTIIETKNAVVQPATQTLINTPSFSSTPATSIIKNSVIPAKSVPVPTIKEELLAQPSNIESKTEFKAEPAAGSPSYDNVLKSIDEILKGQKAEEQASQKPKTKPVELDAKPVTPKSELKNNLINEGTKFAPKDTPASKAASSVLPGAALANGTSATATTDKDADYLLVLRKSLKSLEEDSWANVKLNMGEALDYFAKEKKLYPNNPKLGTYYKIILGFQRFSEGGLELDEGDFADFEDAEALYLDTQDLLEEAQKELSKDYNGEQVNGIVGTVLKYTEEELQYIEEVLGM